MGQKQTNKKSAISGTQINEPVKHRLPGTEYNREKKPLKDRKRRERKRGEKDREEERRRESDNSETELLHRCNTDRNQLKQEPKGSKLQYFYKVSIRNRIYSKSAGKPCWRAPTLTPLYPNTKNSKKGTSQKKISKQWRMSSGKK